MVFQAPVPTERDVSQLRQSLHCLLLLKLIGYHLSDKYSQIYLSEIFRNQMNKPPINYYNEPLSNEINSWNSPNLQTRDDTDKRVFKHYEANYSITKDAEKMPIVLIYPVLPINFEMRGMLLILRGVK